MTFDDLLGQAYREDQINSNRTLAVTMLTDAFDADAGLAAQAATKLTSLSAIVNARSQGGRNSCHVEAICKALLQEALQ